jgi:signal transduction histidine kinase
MNRVINNLLGNSIKYCEQEPIIKIRALIGNQLNIEIEDNGIGINEEDKDKVFNKFYRVNRMPKVKGLGLGLYIVKKIIENHNGKIEIESVWGKGTTVKITLPL